MVKRGHTTIYLLFMLLKLLWWFNFILQFSLSLSLSLLSLYHMCICFTFRLYHICNNILQPLLSSNIILCLFFTNTHLVWYRFLRQKIDFYRYITFYGYGYNIQHSPLNIFWNFFSKHQFRYMQQLQRSKCNSINSNAIPFV